MEDFVIRSKRSPDFAFEKKYWERGFPWVIGVDEVGRGALAGPVVAGAAFYRIQNSEIRIQEEVLRLGIDDSKRLTPKKREELEKIIPEYFYTGIGEASVVEINDVGIVVATEKAMRRAIQEIKILRNKEIKEKIASIPNVSISQFLNFFLLIDGNRRIRGIRKLLQQAIIAGDQKSISIAAASIVAKVYRDRLMKQLSKDFDRYGWDHNVGYGTASHIDALIKYGVTILHREVFVDFLQLSSRI